MKKKKKKIRLHPALVFLILTLVIMIISSIGSILNLEASYYVVNEATGDLTTQVVTINNLFNRTGLQYLISNMINNFLSFAPLGNLIVGLLGIGVAYKSGFLNSLFKMIGEKVPRKFLTFIVVFLGIIFSMFYEVGYVILIPLAAILFMNLGRHPSAGICAAFSGITFGYGANAIVNRLDSVLLDYSNKATSILDSAYNVNLYGNVIFTIVSAFLLSYVGMIVTEKFIIPKLGKYYFDEEEPSQDGEVSKRERKGVIISLLATFVASLLLIYCIIKGLPFSGLLLDLSQSRYVDMLFGEGSYFYQGSVMIFSFMLIFSSLIYGIRVKSIDDNRDLVDGMSYYLKDVASLLVLIFFAAQFCLIFKETNIGIFIVASLSELLNGMQLSGLSLVVITFVIVAISTFFVPMASTKWAMLSPIIVPMFMQASMTPEFAEAVFRAADSSMKGITPLFSYFVILIGYLHIYNKRKNDVITITDAMSLMIPYAIAFTILWLVIILAFYIIGIPIGIGTWVML
ncbi:MAG: AbgT family transporter [Bacilli bacterium]